jgi:hypothetical protein
VWTIAETLTGKPDQRGSSLLSEIPINGIDQLVTHLAQLVLEMDHILGKEIREYGPFVRTPVSVYQNGSEMNFFKDQGVDDLLHRLDFFIDHDTDRVLSASVHEIC